MDDMSETLPETPPKMPKMPETPPKMRRPGRPYKRQLTPRLVETPKAPPLPRSGIVIYRPEFSDPPEIVMFITDANPEGVRFKANEPVELLRSKTIQQLLVEKFETPDGIRSRAVERNVPLLDVLKGNPSFEIDGVKPERIKPLNRLPTDADGYRNFCVGWITVALSANAMDQRWAGEEGLRQRCGVSPSDIGFLRPYFESRRLECAELDRQRRVA